MALTSPWEIVKEGPSIALPIGDGRGWTPPITLGNCKTKRIVYLSLTWSQKLQTMSLLMQWLVPVFRRDLIKWKVSYDGRRR